MSKVDFVIRIAGENGEGVLSVGDLLAQAMAKAGLNIYTFRNLPAEIKGGASMGQVRVSDGPIGAPGDAVDVLFAWNQENYTIHHPQLRETGIILYDPVDCTPDPAVHQQHFPIPLTEIANQRLGERKAKNVVAIGALAGLTGLSEELVETIMQSRYGKRPKQMEVNLKALQAGYELARESLPLDQFRVTSATRRVGPRMIVTGNEAIALGALASGLQYFAGYPITPASDIMEILAKQLPRTGGVLIQTEDEISAICSCIGASYAGRKTMTSTSGPGLSLMVEAIGLATMQETPVVVVDVQRGGPSTGLPTKVEQSDLDLAVYGRHGDAPRIVLAPTTVEDMFLGAMDAFNMAEKYQVPVILMSDQHISHRQEAIPVPDVASIPVVNRKTVAPSEMEDFQRYRFTEDGVSPTALPGIHNVPWVATGLEHNEHAHIDYSQAMHTRMMDKRGDKVARAAKEPNTTHRFGDPKARLGIIGWGSSEGPLRETLSRLSANGIEVQALIARLIFPVPVEPIQEFLDSVDDVVVVELNRSGQYANLLQSQFCRRVRRYNKYDGMPFTSGELVQMVESMVRSQQGVLAS